MTDYMSIVFMIAAGATNAVMDAIKVHYKDTPFSRSKKGQQWMNPATSWRNKWKDGDPKKGERFPGASTVLVFVTDLWHLAKFVMLMMLAASAVFYNMIICRWVDGVIFYVAFTVTFEIFYSSILVRNE